MSTIQTEAVHTALKSAKSAEEAMSIAHLDWTAEQAELVTTNGLSVPMRKAIYRSDTKQVIGVVGLQYTPLQNHEAFAFADTLVEKYGATYEHAYSLNCGANILLQLKINGGFDVRPGDHIDKYINLSNHHDGGGAVLAFSGTLRAWCANQFRLMWQEGRKDAIRIQHKGTTLSERFTEAVKVFNLSQETFAIFQKKCQVLAQKQLDKAMVERFLDIVVGKPIDMEEIDGVMREVARPKIEAKREAITNLFENGLGNGQGTAYDLFNGTTEFIDHHTNLKDDDRRYSSALMGHGADVKQLAFETALAL